MHKEALLSADAIAMGYPCIGPDPDAAPNGLPAGYGAGKGRRRRIMKLKQFLSGILALLFVVSLPVSALAVEWNISAGDITVNAGSGGQTVTQGGGAAVEDPSPVITGSSTENTVTIRAEKDQTANVTLSGANIDVSSEGKAAVTTTGEGNVSIELDGDNKLKSGEKHAGLEKNNGGSLTIGDADKDGKLTAKGGQYGAGIGGGKNGSGEDITISGGEVNASGGAYGAGIGGGYYENGSDITITGGEVNATGGEYGAGIGGGDHGNGSDITITGSKVNATGGKRGAGIGGGNYRIGKDITISGGEVNASGGVTGAGIGGGCYGDGNKITVSGDAKLKVQGGVEDKNYGAGAGIGTGGKYGNHGGPNGAEVEPDICALKPDGKIEYYAPGSAMTGTPPKTVTNPTGDYIWDGGTVTKPATCTEKGVRTYTCTGSTHTRTEDIPALNHSFAGQTYVSDNNATCEQDGTKTAKCVRYGTGGCMATDTVTDTDSKLGHFFEEYVSDNNATYESDGTKTAKCVRYDQCGQTHTIPDAGSRLKISPLYRVTDKDGRDITYTAEQAGGVLTVTADADFAILTGSLSNIRTLKAQGVEKIVFVTKGAASAFALADLLENGSTGKTYKLTHDGKTVTFTLGEDMADVSAILTQP